MFASEKFFFSVMADRAGIHAILWDDKTELVRALLVLRAVMQAVEFEFLAVSGGQNDLDQLIGIIDARRPNPVQSDADNLAVRENTFVILLLQQASSQTVGPWLNGWRTPLSEPPGSILVIRAADFGQFQRNAPDLSSFIGPKVLDSSSMISHFSTKVVSSLSATLPPAAIDALARLPGEMPTRNQLNDWIQRCADESE